MEASRSTIWGSSDAPGSSALCESEATATMFYLRESEASATMFYLCESEASATKRPIGTEINHTLW
ncbi:hypothetical protein ACQKNB_20585 [Lysinibacillus xylanilyticus]|uniref:hypothetical protein n=1 Tax=Lysinibacillus xylanilyticus TaxID=582475 RepID=UPI003D0768D8